MDRLIKQIIAILEADVAPTRGIKFISNGDPYSGLTDRDMPAIIVSPVATAPQTADNMRDEDVFTLSLTLVLDRKDYMNKALKENSAQRAAALIFEETEAGSYDKKTDTIVYAIRKTLDCDTDYALDTNSIAINYQFSGTRETPTYEPTMSFTVQSPVYLRS